MGVGDDVFLVLEELLKRRAEVGSGWMDGVPVENLDGADFWVARGGYKVLDDVGCDGGCATYVRRRREGERTTPTRRGEGPG